MDNINLVKENCTACGACIYVCPVDAISFIKTPLKQEIALANDKCINCGKCYSVCPKCTDNNLSTKGSCFAGYNSSDFDTSDSSSGGVGALLSKSFIDRGGVVVGTTWKDDLCVVFDVKDDESGIKEFSGSKYVQSSPLSVYPKIKQALAVGKEVLFIGLPCQVSAVKKIFKNDNLYAVDLICHGVPPKDYLKEHAKKRGVLGKARSIRFRGKDDFYLTAFDKNGKQIYKQFQELDLYFKSFLVGFTYRENCYSCPFARLERAGDVTIGDFWGLDKSTLEKQYKGKVSLILNNTDKGEVLLKSIEDKCVLEERDIEEAVKHNDQLSHPVKKTLEREVFVKNYTKYGFTGAVKKTQTYKKIKKARKNIFFTKVKRLITFSR